jgi:hypothetical protein
MGARLLALLMSDAPQHIDHPVRFETRPDGKVALAVVEQGSPDHVRAQIARVASFPIGTRDELPEFGITPLAFQRGDLRLDVLRAQIERWVDVDLDAQELADIASLAQRTVHVAAVDGGQGS